VLETVVHWLTETILRLGYPGITILMAVESSFFPFPSEVVLPPAGYLAAQGRMNAWVALGSGLFGSLVGALFNYYLAAYLGRPLLHRYHRFLLMRANSLDRSEAFFRRHGEISTFIGRLVPVIRQLISLPAGVARMRIDLFVAYTALGAGIWCAVLTAVGWYVGKHAAVVEDMDALVSDPEIHALLSRAVLWLLPAIVVVLIAYVLYQRRVRLRRDTGDGGGG